MEGEYDQLLQSLDLIRRHFAKRNTQRLEGFIREIHFQPEPEDDYYKCILR